MAMIELDTVEQVLAREGLADEYGFLLDGVTVGDVVTNLVDEFIVTQGDGGLIVYEGGDNLHGFDEEAHFCFLWAIDEEKLVKPWGDDRDLSHLKPIAIICGDDDRPYYIVWDEE